MLVRAAIRLSKNDISLPVPITGAQFKRIIERMGNVVKLRFMWIDGIFTTEPEHIKVQSGLT